MKNFTYKFFIPALFFAFILTSCDKYLDITPKGKRLLETVNDYDLWLNSTDLPYAVPKELYIMADNIDKKDYSVPPRPYIWSKQFSDNPTATPEIWNPLYKQIYYFNAVLEGIDEATNGTEAQKKSLKAEALLGRSFCYFYLVNLYGKQYNEGTADEDLAVPFVTATDISTPTPERSTVQEIYDHIISDLEAAIPDLPEDNSQNRFRGTVAGAYSILARTYFYMGDYTKAGENAQLALDNGQNTVYDYSTMSSPSSISNLMIRPGAIYARFLTSTWVQEKPIPDFLESFDPADIRLAFYYQGYSPTSIYYRSSGNSYSGAYPNCGTSVAEMRLILAETAARANDLPEAIHQLDLVRKCRFKADDYSNVKYDPTNPVQEEVLQKVLAERRLEFAWTGLRWLDMRRLDAEGRMPDVHRYDGQGNLIATLPAGSNHYTLQIPLKIMEFNPEWQQNPWDEE